MDVVLNSWGYYVGNTVGIEPREFDEHVKAHIEQAFGTADSDEYLSELADAASFSQRGLGVDYSSEPTGFVVGIGANAAVAGHSNIRDRPHPTGGFAASTSLMLGLNLSRWGHGRWSVFANGVFHQATLGDLQGEITNVGAHVQYRVVEPATKSWLGISLTTGLDYTRWKFNTGGATVITKFDVGHGPVEPFRLESVGSYALQSNVSTIPVEASTGARIGRHATLFAGAGIDVDFRTANSVSSNLDGILRWSDDSELGTVEIAGTGAWGGQNVRARLFAGAQVSVRKLKLFVQTNVSHAPAASIAAGIRYVQ